MNRRRQYKVSVETNRGRRPMGLFQGNTRNSAISRAKVVYHLERIRNPDPDVRVHWWEAAYEKPPAVLP